MLKYLQNAEFATKFNLFVFNHFTQVWFNKSRQISKHSSIFQRLCIFTRDSRMLRASLPSSGRLSVRLSVTLVICIKTVQARITKSLLWVAQRSLVYRDKISCHWMQGFPSNEGVKEGHPPPKKNVISPLLARIMWKRLQIGTYMLLIITSTGDRLFGFINIHDLERPWTPQKEVFSKFCAIFGCSAHFNTELRRSGWR